MFDNVMLMVEGKFIYQGKGETTVKNYFSRIGFTCGRFQNPAGKEKNNNSINVLIIYVFQTIL